MLQDTSISGIAPPPGGVGAPNGATKGADEPAPVRRLRITVDMDPNELVDRVTTVGERWAEADGEASMLEETKKTMLAQFTMEHQKGGAATGGKPMSMAQAESMALADPRYKEFLEGMVTARKNANKLKVQYEAGKTKTEFLRTMIANKRAELQMNGLRT